MGDALERARDLAAESEGRVGDLRRELDDGRLDMADMYARELLNTAFQIRKAVIRSMEQAGAPDATSRASSGTTREAGQ